MKIKFQYASGKAVFDYKNDSATLEEAIDLLNNPNVIKITVTKMTPAQYFKKGVVDDGVGK